ncbi:MAG: hypothetical protein AAGI52_10890 [Bacteroidota bacterium]
MPRLLCLALFLASASASAQDLTVTFAFPPGASPEVDEALLAGPNVVQAYELDIDGDGWTEHLVLSFVPREDTPEHASLNNFVASTHEAFLQRLPDRRISSIAVDVADNPLAREGFPFAAYGFYRPVPEGSPPVCDSAALFFESAEGFWTLSWNAPRGWLRGDLSAAFGLIENMTLEPVEATFAIIVEDAEPFVFDRSQLARVR